MYSSSIHLPVPPYLPFPLAAHSQMKIQTQSKKNNSKISKQNKSKKQKQTNNKGGYKGGRVYTEVDCTLHLAKPTLLTLNEPGLRFLPI